MNAKTPDGHGPSSRGTETEQSSRGGDVRPTLDHLVDLVVARIVSDARMGRALPVRLPAALGGGR